MPCNLHNNDIDLDDRSLFEYVTQLEAMEYISELDTIENSIKNTPPKHPKRFGNMTEPFKVDGEEKSTNGFMIALTIVVILLFVVCGIIYSGSCNNNTVAYNNYDNMMQLSPEIGPDVRAIFVRN